MGLIDHVVFPPGDGGFTRDAVRSILRLWDDSRAADARVGSGDAPEIDQAQRRSRLQWIGRHAAPDAFGQFLSAATLANERCGWGFDVDALSPSLQLTQYDAAHAGHYEWHIDLGRDETATRKVSIVALLSDPATFSGGYFQIFRTLQAETVPMELGSILAFPSYLLHRVTPLFDGARFSLVGWGCGRNSFR